LKRRLLYLAPWHPSPLSSGGSLRILNTLEACAACFRVTLVVPAPAAAESEARLRELCERIVHVAPANDSLPLVDWARDALALRVLAGRHTLAKLRPYLEAIASIDERSYDVVWAGQPWLAMAARHPERTIVDLVDVEHLKAARRAALRHGNPAVSAIHALRLWWIEVVSLNRQLARVVSSEDEARYLRRWGLGNVHAVPNAVPIPDSPGRRQPRRGGAPLRLVFVGNMAYDPNVDAVAHFAREVMPLLRASSPGVTLEVIGQPFACPALDELPTDVRMRGFVADLPRALGEFDVYVAPIRMGGGTKLKVLTALACGIPLVTTSVGAEGLGIQHGTHALVCDDPAAMARAVVALVEAPEAAARMAEAGRGHVVARFSWSRVREATAQWLERIGPGLGDNRGHGGAIAG